MTLWEKMAMDVHRFFQHGQSALITASQVSSNSESSFSVDGSSHPPRDGLVVRLRSHDRQHRMSELRCTPRPALACIDPHRYSPTLKPKSARSHQRHHSSASLRSPGVHLDLPERLEAKKRQSCKLPAMLVLRLLEERKRYVRKVTASPSLKFVNIQCPVSAEKPKRQVRLRKKSAQSPCISESSVFDSHSHRDSSLHIRQFTPSEVKSKLPIPALETPAQPPPDCSKRKIVFTRRDARCYEDTIDPDYYQHFGIDYL